MSIKEIDRLEVVERVLEHRPSLGTRRHRSGTAGVPREEYVTRGALAACRGSSA
jgi:hypothetical protein